MHNSLKILSSWFKFMISKYIYTDSILFFAEYSINWFMSDTSKILKALFLLDISLLNISFLDLPTLLINAILLFLAGINFEYKYLLAKTIKTWKRRRNTKNFKNSSLWTISIVLVKNVMNIKKKEDNAIVITTLKNKEK